MCVKANQNHFSEPSRFPTARRKVLLECLTKWWTLANNQKMELLMFKTYPKSPMSSQFRRSCKLTLSFKNPLTNKTNLQKRCCKRLVLHFLTRNGLQLTMKSMVAFRCASKNFTKVKSSLRICYNITRSKTHKSCHRLPSTKTKFIITATPSRFSPSTTSAKSRWCHLTPNTTRRTKAPTRWITTRSSSRQRQRTNKWTRCSKAWCSNRSSRTLTSQRCCHFKSRQQSRTTICDLAIYKTLN